MKVAAVALLLVTAGACAGPLEDLLDQRESLARRVEQRARGARTLAERDAAQRPLRDFDMQLEAALRARMELASARAQLRQREEM